MRRQDDDVSCSKQGRGSDEGPVIGSSSPHHLSLHYRTYNMNVAKMGSYQKQLIFLKKKNNLFLSQEEIHEDFAFK